MSKSQRFTIEDLQRKGYVVGEHTAVKANKKVIGTERKEQDGKKFASKLELYFYNLLTAFKIPFLFQVPYVIQEAFIFHGAKIQPIKIIVDFELPDHDLIIDTKGFALAHTKIKIKMLKNKLVNDGRKTRIELPSTKEECEKLINKLISCTTT